VVTSHGDHSRYSTRWRFSGSQQTRKFLALWIAGTGDAVFLIHGTFIRQFRLLAMSEQATTKLIGLSVSAIFLMMLMLRAITS